METTLRYGQQAILQLDLPAEAVVIDRPGPPGIPLDDPAAAVAAAVHDPLDFPPLSQAVVVGDRVAIALEAGVPQSPQLIAGLVHALLEAAIEPGNITILQSQLKSQLEQEDPRAALPDAVRDEVQLVTHEASDRAQLSFLAPSEQGHAVYFNRVICDADLVIPVGCLRADESLGNVGLNAGLYPTFADDEAQRRFQAPSSTEQPVSRRRREEEADEAAWLLGILFTVQILPGPGDSVLQVLAGQLGAVSRQGRKLMQQAWTFDLPRRGSLVVATVEGGPEQQTWENFARALFAARGAVEVDGDILICTELSHPPGPALQKLCWDDEQSPAIGEIRRDRTPDAVTASQLWQTLREHRVYLLSHLDSDTVESLGMAYVSSGEEIAHLSRRHASCVLLGNAHRALPRTS